METTQNETQQQMNINGEMEDVETASTEGQTAAPGKKERKKKDLSGEFHAYATTNPFNGTPVVKRFRVPEVPIGVVFVKFKEGTQERVKFAQFPDGSVAWTWTTHQKRFDATIKDLASGKRPYIDVESVTGQTNITEVAIAPEETKAVKERKPRQKKEKVSVEGAETPINKADPRSPQFSFFDSEEEAPEVSEPDDMPIESETRKENEFSFRKEAIQYAKSLGMDKKQAEAAVKKVDGSWMVVQG